MIPALELSNQKWNCIAIYVFTQPIRTSKMQYVTSF